MVSIRRRARVLDDFCPPDHFRLDERRELRAAARRDIHAKVGKTIYSIPWRLIGQRLHARSTATMVQFFHNGTLVATRA